MNPDKTTIAIMEERVSARHDLMHIDDLLFLPENPRVYAAIREIPDFDNLTDAEQQGCIYKQLLQESSVKNLLPEIRRDGGLHDSIIVRHDTRQVIEGNSRLAAYRKLAEEDKDDRWIDISCLVVSRLTDNQQTRLLAQAHLQGKTDWSPYAKALFCFRRFIEEGQEISTLADLSGFTPAEIKKNVEIIKLMEENADKNSTNFSYYDVLVRNRSISPAIKDDLLLRDALLSQVKSGSFTAQEMRDRLPAVIKKPKLLKKYTAGDVTLEDAYDRAKISGAEKRLKKIRDGLNDIEKDQIDPLKHNELKAVQQVVRHIGQSLKRVTGMIECQLADKSSNS